MAQKSAALLAAEAALEEAKAAHLRDLNTVFSALAERAEQEGWCHEYTEFVDILVSRLSVKPTKGVESEHELEVLGDTVKVRAISEDAAIEKLHDFLSN